MASSLQLSQHFTWDDVTRSQTAARRGISNDLPLELRQNVIWTAQMLERIRGVLGVPMLVTSWYRSLALNRAIGSSDGSDHVRGLAVDFVAPGFGSPYRVAAKLAPLVDSLQIGQLINEYPDASGWVHVSTRIPDKVINRVITIKRSGTAVGILP